MRTGSHKRNWHRPAAVLAVLAAAVATIAGGDAPVTPAMAELQRADDLLIVDCMLPGQVRRLGTQTTYVSARRAVKTSARDCEIRGGEYVAYDRASFASSLNIWLPLAEEGDVEAMTYVGEIFERGLGLPPEYEVAAAWYRAAAEAGSSRAAINLGSLYEQGLGVPADPAEAVRWYRRASGLPDLSFEVAPPDPALSQELDRLRGEVGELRRALEDAQRELDDARDRLERSRGDADAERSEIERLQRELEERRRAAAETVDQAELERTRAMLAEREAELGRQEQDIAELRRSMDALRAESESRRERLAEAEADAGAAERAELAELQAQILRRAEEFEQLRSALVDRQESLAAAQRELAARQAGEEANRAAVRELEDEIASREARLAEKDREIAELRASLARLESETVAQREEIARLQPQAAAEAPVADAAPSIEIIEPELSITRGTPTVRLRSLPEQLVVVGRVRAAAGLLSLTVNGEELPLETEELFRARVPLAGHGDQVQVVAVDRDGKRSTMDFEVVAGSAAAALEAGTESLEALEVGFRIPGGGINFGRYHALVIGNNDYQMLPPLRTAVNDARVVGEILRDQYGFQVTLLLDATRYDILSTLNRLREQLGDDDNLLVYYAGHGELDRVNQRGNWLPVDAEPTSTANWISNIAITDILNAMSVRQLIVIADSCYSGTLTRNVIGRLEPGQSEATRRRLLESMVEQRARMVLTSGGLEPVLDGAGGPHSVFAQALIEILRENIGVLAGQELFQLVLPRVAATADQVDFRQIPEYAPIRYAGHESGDFFFVRQVN